MMSAVFSPVPPARVLLVTSDQDDFLICKDLLRAVAGLRCELEWLSSADAALSALSASGFDVALVDAEIAGASGLELIRRARANGGKRPMLLMALRSTGGLEAAAAEVQIADILYKNGLDADRLGRAIRHAIEDSARQQALDVSEQRYRALFQDSPAPMMVCDPNRLTIIAANDAAHELLAAPARALIGRRLVELLDQRDWPRLRQVQALLGQGRSWPRSTWRCLRRDKKLIFVELKSRIVGAPNQRAIILHLQDVSESIRAQQTLKEMDAHFRQLIDHANDPLVVIDAERTILYLNPRAERLLAGSREALLGSRLRLDMADPGGRNGTLHLADGSRRQVELYLSPTRWDNGAAQVVTLHDASEAQRVAAELERVRTLDPVTGLTRFDRSERDFERQLMQAGDAPMAMLFVNLDRFYAVNDAFGHLVGNRILNEIASRLTAMVGRRGRVTRVAGDEFLLLLEDAPVDRAWSLAEAVVNAVSEPIERDGFRTIVTASVGVALFPDHGRDVASLMRNAEAAMTQAKRNGRDCVTLFAADQGREVADRLHLGGRLREAIRAGEMVLHYQPQIDSAERRLVGFEGLIRWQSPELGLLSPGRFVPIAESMGLMAELGSWVIYEACRQIREWMDAGASDFTLSVNVAAQQLSRPGLVATVSEALRRYQIPAEMLELEMTESSVMENVERVKQVLRALKGVGVKLALDDFGTGYSSLAYLKQFSLDKLKIDRSFVRELPDDSNDAAIARTIIAMGHQLKMRVSAEGIETERQRDYLLSIGCDELQGFYFGAGEPAEVAARRLLGATRDIDMPALFSAA